MTYQKLPTRALHFKGFSLVELLIAMAVGLVILAGVVRVMADSKSSFLFEEETAYIQENARFLTDRFLYDLRMAGNLGCPRSLVLDLDNIDADGVKNIIPNNQTVPQFSEIGVRGHTDAITSYAGGAALPAQYDDIEPDTDIIVINYGEPIDGMVSQSHGRNFFSGFLNFARSPTEPNATVGPAGTSLIISDAKCRSVGIVSNLLGTDDTQVRYITTAFLNPGDQVFKGQTLSSNASILKLKSHGYYIKEADPAQGRPQPSLYMVESLDGGSIRAQELLRGVDDMRILYGILTIDANNVSQLQFLPAEDVGSQPEDWLRVAAVRADFVLRSSREVFGANTNVDLGSGFTYNDRFMRQRITLSATLRN